MESWEETLNAFLEPWKKRQDVIGFLVCGSYITGTPTKRSDIDLHIITSEEKDWRERGSKIVNGYLIEYFVNPPKQIRAYFREDHRNNKTDSQTMFITGKILYDKDGSLAELKKEAKIWLDKEFTALDETSLKLGKYGLWDTLDNLQNIYEFESKSFKYAYYIALRDVLEFYSRHLRWEVYSPERVFELMTDPATQKKYLQSEYPDPVFRDMFVKAITVEKESEMLKCFESIAKHIFKKIGGFKLDGWTIRTQLDLKHRENSIKK